MRLLVVEDDSDLRRLLERGLSEEGYELEMARNGHDALAAADARPPALIVLDIGLPDTDGRDLCQALRSRGVMAPVLFLTARDSVPDRVSGFGVGGDDYLTKPFEFAELVARLGALARRARVDTAVSTGDLRLDPVKHGAEAGGQFVALTPTEFRLLGALAGRAGETLGRRELVTVAWPPGAIVHDNTLDVYIGRLRRKLSELRSETEIRTAHGIGYRLE
jgi:two-component system OmpR family response regulator